MPLRKVNLRLPFLFRTSLRRGKDFDYFVLIVPFSFYSSVEIKKKPRKFVGRHLGKRSVNSPTSVCTKEMLPGKMTRFLGSHKNRLIFLIFFFFLLSVFLSFAFFFFFFKVPVVSGGFRLVPDRFRVVPAGSGRFRVIPVGSG